MCGTVMTLSCSASQTQNPKKQSQKVFTLSAKQTEKFNAVIQPFKLIILNKKVIDIGSIGYCTFFVVSTKCKMLYLPVSSKCLLSASLTIEVSLLMKIKFSLIYSLSLHLLYVNDNEIHVTHYL